MRALADDTASARAALAAGLTAASRTLDAWSKLFTAFSLLACLLSAPNGRLLLGLVLLAGLGQLYFATRIAVDRSIFAYWAERWRFGAVHHQSDLESFDRALAESGLRPQALPTRPLSARLAGLRRLLRWQIALSAVQIAAVLVFCGLTLST